MSNQCQVLCSQLKEMGVEVLPRGDSRHINLPENLTIEAPASLKWAEFHHSLELGAFSYQVSGYCFAARIGRYCSIGENVQIGRQNHPTSWASTSPALYLKDKLFDVGKGFSHSDKYHNFQNENSENATRVKVTTIGNDVWIGHGAYICAGVTIGHGAIIGAHSVVSKDVPPYAIVAGNPAVIKRWRIDAILISPMLKSRWWRFAPWQLKNCSPSSVEQFVHNVMHLACAPFEPTLIDSKSVGSLSQG
jgi:chloramphenicol O-acetyltransferase type B